MQFPNVFALLVLSLVATAIVVLPILTGSNPPAATLNPRGELPTPACFLFFGALGPLICRKLGLQKPRPKTANDYRDLSARAHFSPRGLPWQFIPNLISKGKEELLELISDTAEEQREERLEEQLKALKEEAKRLKKEAKEEEERIKKEAEEEARREEEALKGEKNGLKEEKERLKDDVTEEEKRLRKEAKEEEKRLQEAAKAEEERIKGEIERVEAALDLID